MEARKTQLETCRRKKEKKDNRIRLERALEEGLEETFPPLMQSR